LESFQNFNVGGGSSAGNIWTCGKEALTRIIEDQGLDPVGP
jgi:hypothetical protein